MTERCQQMAGLLRGLRSCATADDDARISELLESVSMPENMRALDSIY